ncbi:MAG: CPBP family intramembrane metalloprotease [Gemmataceae bacterium]|nr:CPBP family intramembrane metalloprotease [Gemmataceae bacterium]
MTRPTSLDPDDDVRPAYEVVEDDAAEAACRRCRRAIAGGRAYCPYCGASQLGPAKARPVVRAKPVARPRDDDDRYAEPVDPDDPLDADEVPYADVRRRRRRKGRAPKRPGQGRLGPMFSGYVVMMAVSVCFGVLMLAAVFTRGGLTDDEQNWGMVAVEAVDAVLVLGVAALVGRIPPHPTRGDHRLAAWLGALPVLAALLTLNIGFVVFVRQLAPDAERPAAPALTVGTALLMCLQPAVVEEWFFRHLALGSLRERWGVPWGVVVSGAMFAAAHIYNPVGMPYLFLLGVCLGYLRVWSGSLALPMVLHFVHNAVVLLAARWV